MSNVVITGAGGYIGQRLIEDLNSKKWCSKIYGIDINEPKVKSEKLHFEKKDVRDSELGSLWKDKKIDTLVHLAFIVNPMHDNKKMYDINVNGTLNIMKHAKALKVKHLIIASSGTAYGAWKDNPYPIKESDPIRTFPETFNYAHHKGVLEKHIENFSKENPDIIVSTVRPSIVYGPNTENYLSRFIDTLPFIPLISGCDPKMQFVHEEDVADFFSLLIEKKVAGAFNLGGDGVIKFSEIAKMVNKRSIYTPTWVMKKIMQVLWTARLVTEAPPGIINYIKYEWVLDSEKAKKELGWKPEYTTKQTLRIMLDKNK